jgi:hypothetical protein
MKGIGREHGTELLSSCQLSLGISIPFLPRDCASTHLYDCGADAPASKPGGEAKGNHKSSPGKPVAITLKEAQAKIVGAWARLEDGKLPRDEKGNLTGSILSFDANNRITFRIDTDSVSRYVMTNPMSYRIEKDSASGLLVLSGDLGLKFAIISIDADKLSIRYIDHDNGKPVDWVAKWQRISNDPISPN